ncbi:MAG: bifunctional diaminohydroxyphosphoribosylaminopyrimidine deaminase/5-amino-6-(5-phosphoribosylamino)uracil reductase RibD [Pseudomonadota bacterium]
MMTRAVRLAERARYWARPNPHVGCVICKGGEIVGEGFTQPPGNAHAEVMAMQQAGADARGATVYVTLEPCSHYGRTPPCADALIRTGVQRVVLAVMDPHPSVNGRGAGRMREAGLQVDAGLMAAEVEAQLRGFLLRHRRGRGRVRAKLAMSLDGRTAMASGESQWITGPAARCEVQRMRADSCAILTGVGTVLGDDCALTVRQPPQGDFELPDASRYALRVVADTQLRTPEDAAVLRGPQASLLLHAPDVPVPPSLANVPREGVAATSSGLDPAAILDAIARRECNEILLESGPQLAGSMLRSGLVDELVVFMAPKLLGSDARPLLQLSLDKMAQAHRLTLRDQRRFGSDLKLVFECESAGTD